jgi:phosphoglycerate dehydrogenase-like enzyme
VHLPWLAGVRTGLVQSQSIGYDGIADVLPAGMVYANAVSVHEASTAELSLALMLASQRGLADFVRLADAGSWEPVTLPSLADRTVLLIGYGGVGRAIESRLLSFETTVVRVARTGREDERGTIHAVSELPSLLPLADIVVIAVPFDASTDGLVDAAFLAAMPDGALLVNIARGAVVDTEALMAELRPGRLRAGLDVTEPEPLPAGHPLFTMPGVIITPHLGGATTALQPRLLRLVGRQIERMLAGLEPVNVVLRS